MSGETESEREQRRETNRECDRERDTEGHTGTHRDTGTHRGRERDKEDDGMVVAFALSLRYERNKRTAFANALDWIGVLRIYHLFPPKEKGTAYLQRNRRTGYPHQSALVLILIINITITIVLVLTSTAAHSPIGTKCGGADGHDETAHSTAYRTT